MVFYGMQNVTKKKAAKSLAVSVLILLATAGLALLPAYFPNLEKFFKVMDAICMNSNVGLVLLSFVLSIIVLVQ